ncbi:hypothetical protein BH09MYX1_BH09MYX1_54180 [soil metagenome]
MRSRLVDKGIKIGALFGAFLLASILALHLRGGGLWQGLAPASAAGGPESRAAYDLTQLKVVNQTLDLITKKYVDPKRVKPKEMLLSSLNYVQRDVAQIIIIQEENSPTVKIRVDTAEKEFRVDQVLGPWDVSAKLREIFAFIQDNLRGTEVDLREVEYAACNGMLHTLDPHSVLLSPEAYKDMNMTTSGHFGGLGIVISLRDQQLTVIKPMPNTPASRAGVRKDDRIQKINGESTLNMGLNEAVNHLRGNPGSTVTVWIHRDGPDGWQGLKPFALTRESIKVESVEHKLLDGNIGYVRLKGFQMNTFSDMEAALTEMKGQGPLKGLVLDLRGNPGGLLDQAVKIVDKFVSSGPIVATVGASEGRDEKNAHENGTEPNYPIALLVSGNSASASEIVAGALKNHDRAVIVGDTSFGKGSVQIVFDKLPDQAALKLTVAQYLTEPGDISIQGTGVTPDIQLDPMTADLIEMDLNADSGGIRERDLTRSLSNSLIRTGQKPLETVRYDLTQKERQELRERGGDPDDVFSMDFQIKFAHDLLQHIPQGNRPDQVRAAKPFIDAARVSEIGKLSDDLKKIGVDWSPPPAAEAQAPAVPPLEIKLESDRPGNEAKAGDPMSVSLTVTNKGTVTLYRLMATTKSDNAMFDNKELVIGKLEPGKSRTVTAALGWCDVEGRKIGSSQVLPKDAPRVCKIPKEALTRSDGIKAKFEEARSIPIPDAELRVTTRALDRPTFSYSYEIVDNRVGNGDGRLQKGEQLTMYMTVRNTGKGQSFDAQSNLKNLSGEGLLLKDGRFNDVSNMKPGDEKRFAFTFDVSPTLEEPEVKVELAIVDQDLRESIVEKIHIPIAAPAEITAMQGGVKANPTGALLFASPDATARGFGRLLPGTNATALGATGDYYKVSLGQARFAFVKKSDVTTAPTGGTTFEDIMLKAPPSIEIMAPDLATKESHMMIKGIASDGEHILDSYIFVGSKKVFYRSNRNGTDPKKMTFEADLPLRPGINFVSVVARENPDTTSRRVFVIRKDGEKGELLPTPKTDDDLAENSAGGGD